MSTRARGGDGRQIKGGVRDNIIPDSVEMRGTIRSLTRRCATTSMERRVEEMADAVASGSAPAPKCSGCITKNYPVTVNDPALTEAMAPTLGAGRRRGAAQVVPQGDGVRGLLLLPAGARPLLLRRRRAAGRGPGRVAPNHSPRFRVDEAGLLPGCARCCT